MTDNVVIAIIAASAVVISAVCVLAGAIYSNAVSKDAINRRLDKIDATLTLIQSDMREWSNQIFKIKAHIKMD